MSERNVKLGQWLERMNATLLHSHEHAGGSLSMYNVNGRVIVVQRYSGNLGWQIYVPASEKNKTEDTLTAVEAACGLVSDEGNEEAE